jgi:hypothetical protein
MQQYLIIEQESADALALHVSSLSAYQPIGGVSAVTLPGGELRYSQAVVLREAPAQNSIPRWVSSLGQLASIGVLAILVITGLLRIAERVSEVPTDADVVYEVVA